MRFMLLVYSAEDAWNDGEREACFAESTELCRALESAGQFIDASPLESVSVATSVRVREGKRLVTDGPFAETREQLGGFYLVEAADLDEAIAIAAKVPAAKKGTVEIRPVHELEPRSGR